MNRLLVILLVFFCFVSGIRGQNTGFLGKHFSLNYNLYFSQALSGPSEHGGNGFFSWNTHHQAYIDAALARRYSMGLSFSYIKTRFSFDRSINDVVPVPGSSDYYVSFSSMSQGDIEAYAVGIYHRIFFKGSIAPLGTYIKPEFSLQFVKVYPGYPVYSTLFYASGYGGPSFLNKSPYLNYILSLEIGQNRLLFRRLFIDYGFKIAMTPKIFTYRDVILRESNYLEVESLRRLSKHMLFNVKVGVGLLLF